MHVQDAQSSTGNDSIVGLDDLASETSAAERLLRRAPPGLAERQAQAGIRCQRFECAGERAGIAWRNCHAVDAGGRDFGGAASGTDDDRPAACHAFSNRQAERLRRRAGMNDDVEGANRGR